MARKFVGTFGYCDFCDRERELMYCKNCAEYYCDDCVNQHDDEHYDFGDNDE